MLKATTTQNTFQNSSLNAQQTNKMLRVIGRSCPKFYGSRWSNALKLRNSVIATPVKVSQVVPGTVTAVHTNRCFSQSSHSLDIDPTAEEQMKNFEQFALDNANENITEVAKASDHLTWSTTWYYPQDHFVDLINFIHDISGMNYAYSIVATTIAVRIVLVPMFVSAQRNSSRVAHMMPEMTVLKERMEKIDKDDKKSNMEIQKQVQRLFKKYDCNPMKSMITLLQMPVFISYFFGLRKMLEYFSTELSTGGVAWFIDLTATDPYCILPASSALTFLAMTELNKGQMMASNPQQGKIMLAVMRGLSLVMIPITLNFESLILCYFVTNNTFSLFQTAVMKHPGVKRSLGIWDPPPPIPGSKSKNVVEMIQDTIKGAKTNDEKENHLEKIKVHNAAIDANLEQKARRKIKRKKR